MVESIGNGTARGGDGGGGTKGGYDYTTNLSFFHFSFLLHLFLEWTAEIGGAVGGLSLGTTSTK